MEKIQGQSKSYEMISVAADPHYESIIAAIEIVKKFIIEHGLIIYGGSAIDYALRLRGDKIYPDEMLAVPDLDFYSPNNVEHSYELADILYNRGYKSARAINAQHMETMRVDAVDNHFIADITYRPPEIFKTLPYLEYAGMKIIHPTFQRIDVHSSLSYPYDNPPQEVIFSRWAKDIKRFNLLDKYYPIEVAEKPLMRKLSVPAGMRKYVFGGFAAYAIIYTEFAAMCAHVADVASAGSHRDIIPATITLGDNITFETPKPLLELLHFDIDRAAKEIGLKVRKYEPYANMRYLRVEDLSQNIIIYSTAGRLLSVNSVIIQGEKFRVSNTQSVLQHFISMSFVDAERANTYLALYKSLIKMIEIAESHESFASSALYPSVNVYGNQNINLAREISLNRLFNALKNTPLYTVPQNYYPERKIPKGLPHPEFNPANVIFFQESGKEITEDVSHETT